MTKLLNVLKGAFSDEYTEPAVHFHQGTAGDRPEVCHEDACERPHLKALAA